MGQVLLKKSANSVGSYSLKGPRALGRFLGEVLSKPSLWLGLAAMAVGLIVWMIALAHGDLSLVFSLGSMQYVFILLASRAFLDEKIDKMKLAGTLMVVAGIILIALS